MRLQVSLNDQNQYIASIQVGGYLSAHLNISDRPKEDTKSSKLRVEGFETHKRETVSVKWPQLNLSIGDTVQLKVLDEGLGDAPTERKSTTESNTNLLVQPELAAEFLSACQAFESKLMSLLERAISSESEEEQKKLKRACGHVMAELGDRFYSPIYRAHSHLIPKEQQGELL